MLVKVWLVAYPLPNSRKKRTNRPVEFKEAYQPWPPGLAPGPEQKKEHRGSIECTLKSLKRYIHHLLTFTLFLLLFIHKKAKPEIPLEAKTYGNAKWIRSKFYKFGFI